MKIVTNLEKVEEIIHKEIESKIELIKERIWAKNMKNREIIRNHKDKVLQIDKVVKSN